ncbi:cytochrome c peroxidase [Thiogranum longum]|uniref:Cytochrome c peroxidase n=1 Tax=Thiogranum longum TaxID=1537524 RepID=A0A4V2PGK3_9GAMM|nr:cytochrome c peroxidase [Thiogranum longum]TCK17176.1 cytochrome c peroxidase [Thiogranum longum]
MFRQNRVLLGFVIAVFSSVSLAGKGGRLPAPVSDSDFQDFSGVKVELGRQLFFDKVLSGNRNTSCATCHHVLTDTGDGLSLPVGEGGSGLGVTRDTGSGDDAVHERVPRNAPPVFNLGAAEFTRMFHDGRVEVNASFPSGIASPAGLDLPEGLDSVLAAQAMFPVTSAAEMAGQAGENTVADAAAAGDLAGVNGVWAQIARRLQAIPGYVDQFVAAYDDVDVADDITFAHAANAIAAFESDAWRATNSPFDRFLRGERGAMSKSAVRGMKLFYGKANCSGCHSGTFQTDMDFHAIAMPQIGPGRGDGFDGHDDFGRAQVTGLVIDRYKFRTPTLRNVVLTGPWGHAGAYNSLEAVVRHHLDPVAALYDYDRSQAVLPSRDDLDAQDFVVMDDPSRIADIAAAAADYRAVRLNARQVGYLLDFLNALTDPDSIDLRADMPTSVPSGLSLVE